MPNPNPNPNPDPGSVCDPEAVDEPDRWSGFDTPAHHAAQDSCRHLIHCAVDAATRRCVVEALDYARTVGDLDAIRLLLAQLTGPCCLPPHPPPTP
jgi:hypothetical protein